MIDEAENEKQRDDENDERDDLTQKVRNRRLFAPFKVNVPNVTIDQRNDERAAQQDCCSTDMHAPRRLQSVDSQRRVKCECQTEKLIQNSQANFGASF